MKIREILPEDNVGLAKMIRSVLTEFGVNRPGTVFTDPTTDHLFELFETPNSKYFVLVDNERIIGGCGIYPTKGLPEGCVELVKLYLDQSTRGTGMGKELMLRSIEAAKEMGYTSVYLETMPELSNAIGLYKKLGFEDLPNALGASGHHACHIWMLKSLIN